MLKIQHILVAIGSLLSVQGVSQAAQDPSLESRVRGPTLAQAGEAIFQSDLLWGASDSEERPFGSSDQPHQFQGDLFGPEKRLLPQDILSQPEKSKKPSGKQKQ